MIVRIKDILTRIFLIFLAVLAVTVCIRAIVKNICMDRYGMNNRFTSFVFDDQFAAAQESVAIDWNSLYPAQETTDEAPVSSQATHQPIHEIADKLSGFMGHIQSGTKQYTTERLCGYEFFVQGAKIYESAIGWNIPALVSEVGTVAKLENGYLAEYHALTDISAPTESVLDFASFCEAQGVPFVYVMAPGKISKYEDSSISGVLDFSNQMGDSFLNTLAENGVDYLDLREEAHEDGIPLRSLFFRTDHHWTPQAGLWAAGKIAENLNGKYHLSLDTSLLNKDSYDEVIYENRFLGTLGRKVSAAQADREDFSLFYPKSDTFFTLSIPSLQIDTSGDFSILYDMSMMDADYIDLGPYDTYLYSNRPLIQIENHYVDNGKKILILKDSFNNCMAPFFATAVSKLDVIDLRYFGGSVKTYIEETKPDLVMTLYTLSDLDGDAGLYNFR